MKIIVDPAQRYGKMRAHTATHLLHFALDQLLQGTKQAGSLVDTDLLRFDFATSKAIEPQELTAIQDTINQQIAQWYTVSVSESTLNQAKQLWAKAFFEDKYGEVVRVVHIQWTDLKSVELCGGIHVSSTSHIWAFLITGQESVSSWVRRITAVTGPKVAEYASQLTDQIHSLADQVDAQPAQLERKITKIITQLSEQTKQIESLNAQVALGYLSSDFPSAHGIDRIIKVTDSPLASLPWKELVNILKSQDDSRSRLLYTTEWNYALSHPEAKSIAQEHELKGWGATGFVQGRDEKVITLVA